jgi:transposase
MPQSNGMDAPALDGIDVPKWKCKLPLNRMGASAMKITTVGIDLAKNVFQVHGVDERGNAVLRKQLRRAQVSIFFGNLPPCVIGMEACASAHHWGRTLQRYGHTVRLMAPQFVKPYIKTNKNDVADAEAICEAVSRPNMRFVPIKSIEQQAILSVHRVRHGFVKARTAQGNQIRGLLGEYGLVIPKGICHVAKRVPEILEDAGNELPASFRQLISRLTEHLKDLDRQVKDFERQIIDWHRNSPLSRKLEAIPGIGALAASALVASIADANSFKNGRQVSAWLGLVPRQHSSGGKSVLLGISKRGDAYLRTLLVHGARSAILAAQRKTQNTNVWLSNLLNRRHTNIAAVALANKNARTVWALLAHGRDFQPDYAPVRVAG